MFNLISEKDNYALLRPISSELLESRIGKTGFKLTNYDIGEVIHFDGDRCSNLEIILFGKVSVERIEESGNLLTIAEFYKGDILGGGLVFSKNPYYPMTIMAKDETMLLEIGKSQLLDLCCENKDFLIVFLELISDQTLLLGNKIKHYVNRSIRESIIAFLKYEHIVQGSNKIVLEFTKKELAERIGVQRTSLSRELQKMRNEGLLCYDSDSITILNL